MLIRPPVPLAARLAALAAHGRPGGPGGPLGGPGGLGGPWRPAAARGRLLRLRSDNGTLATSRQRCWRPAGRQRPPGPPARAALGGPCGPGGPSGLPAALSTLPEPACHPCPATPSSLLFHRSR
eukprot:gene13859-biopygen4867